MKTEAKIGLLFFFGLGFADLVRLIRNRAGRWTG